MPHRVRLHADNAECQVSAQVNGGLPDCERLRMLWVVMLDISNRDIGLRYRVDTHKPTHRGDAVGRNRTAVLEFAVLGLLHRTPMHGYELSKQLNMLLGTFRALSYGTLYPCLNKLFAEGLIAKEGDEPADAQPVVTARPSRAPGRSKIVYRLTAEGKERFQDLLTDSGPAAWEDDEFGVHFAFFGL